MILAEQQASLLPPAVNAPSKSTEANQLSTGATSIHFKLKNTKHSGTIHDATPDYKISEFIKPTS